MASLKDLKNRIESVKNTRKITKAMQMVAAAKLRRAQEAAEMARPYSERMGAVMGNLTSGIDADSSGAPKLLSGTGSDQTHLLIVATGERGLAGGFNTNIAKLARQHANDLLQQGKKVKIITIGKKGREQLKHGFKDHFVGHVDLSDVKRIGYDNAQSIASDVIARFEAGEFDVATLFFSKFESVIAQVPTARQIIPFVSEDAGEEKSTDKAADKTATADYDYEPSEEAILTDLLPRAIATEVFAALLENNASFYGAQMTAMDNATRNAGEMIDSLTIEYNRSRQAAITSELIEIISGAEAL